MVTAGKVDGEVRNGRGNEKRRCQVMMNPTSYCHHKSNGMGIVLVTASVNIAIVNLNHAIHPPTKKEKKKGTKKALTHHTPHSPPYPVEEPHINAPISPDRHAISPLKVRPLILPHLLQNVYLLSFCFKPTSTNGHQH